MRPGGWMALFAMACGCGAACAQEGAGGAYSRVNTFGVVEEYSNDSSHIVLGLAEHRKIGAVGFQYARRLVHTDFLDFSYAVELRPAMIVSDPTLQESVSQPPNPVEVLAPVAVTACQAGTFPLDDSATAYDVQTCGRRSTFAEGLSPVGFRMQFLTKHRLQPVFSNYEGYMFSTRPVPIPAAGAFNFTFEFGAGLELYLSHRRSVRLEYALQHFSNKNSANVNPGVDSGLIKLTYSFGR